MTIFSRELLRTIMKLTHAVWYSTNAPSRLRAMLTPRKMLTNLFASCLLMTCFANTVASLFLMHHLPLVPLVGCPSRSTPRFGRLPLHPVSYPSCTISTKARLLRNSAQSMAQTFSVYTRPRPKPTLQVRVEERPIHVYDVPVRLPRLSHELPSSYPSSPP